MEIRKATITDISDLTELMVQFNKYFDYETNPVRIKRSLQQFFKDDQIGVCFVLDNDKLIGYGILTYGFSFEYGGRDAFIDEIFVESDLRGRGYGEKLMDVLLNAAVENGVNAVHLEVEKNNDQAAALYEKFDFDFTGRILRTKLLKTIEQDDPDPGNGGIPDRDFKDFMGCGG